MGLLRFPPRLLDRFIEEGRKNLLYGEFVRGEDGKYRYIKQERIKVYRMLHDLLKAREENLFIYLCMEREDIWQKVTGLTVEDNKTLIGFFDKRIENLFGGNI
jgi:spore photoproduct lyase